MRIATTAAAMALAIGTSTFAQFQINEVRSGSGANEYIEIAGKPGSSLNGVTFLIIGDGVSSGATPTFTGVVEWKWTFTKSDVIGSNGFLVLRNPLMTDLTVNPAATDLSWIVGDPPTTETGFEGSDNQTYMLVSDYSGTDTFVGRAPNQGAGGQDLDTDDDGVLDVTPWTSIIDSVSLIETNGSAPLAGQDQWYSAHIAGPYVSRTVVQATTGTVIAGWDFQTTTNPNGGTAAAAQPNTPKVFNSNAGVGTLYLDGTNGSSDWLQASELNSFGGTATNANANNGFSTVTSGTASLALVNQTANTKSAVFKFSMAAYLGVNVSYATQRTSTGFMGQQWAWSTDGASWTDIDLVTPPSSFGLRSLAELTALDGAADAYLRVTFDGASTAAGNNRLDNVQMLSNPVTSTSVVTNYGAPVHVFMNTGGTWDLGTSSTTDSYDTPGAANATLPTYTCGDPSAGPCEAAHTSPFCSNECCCNYVCGMDPFCCETRWDSICEGQALGCSDECSGGGECPADLNLDGSVSGADLGLLLGGWGGGDYDLDGDGVVSGADLGVLLAAWGACPA